MGVRSAGMADVGGVTYAKRGKAGVLVREPCSHWSETRANMEEEAEAEIEEEDDVDGGEGATQDTPLPLPAMEDTLVYTPWEVRRVEYPAPAAAVNAEGEVSMKENKHMGGGAVRSGERRGSKGKPLAPPPAATSSSTSKKIVTPP